MKKGFAHKGHSVMKVNPRWYYNWGMYKTPGVDCEFIPMKTQSKKSKVYSWI